MVAAQTAEEARQRARAEAAEQVAAGARAAEETHRRVRDEEDKVRSKERCEFEALQHATQQRLKRHGELAVRKSRLDELQKMLTDLEQARALAHELELTRQETVRVEEAEAMQRVADEAGARIRMAHVERARKEAEHHMLCMRPTEEAYALAQGTAEEGRLRLVRESEEERVQEAREELQAMIQIQQEEALELQKRAVREEEELQRAVAAVRREKGKPSMSEEDCLQAILDAYAEREKQYDRKRMAKMAELEELSDIITSASDRERRREQEKRDTAQMLDSLLSMETLLLSKPTASSKRRSN